MTKFTSPTSNPTFPVTRKDCGEDPETCQHMEGTIIGERLFDARCNLPLPDSEFPVKVAGWEETIKVNKERLIQQRAICGFGNFDKGIRRRI